MAKMDAIKQQTLKLDFNERCNDFPDWASDALDEFPKENLWRYPERQRLEASLADFYRISKEQVLATNGADEAIQLLISCLDKNTTVILPTPTFSMYELGLNEWKKDFIKIPPADDLSLNISVTQQEVSKQKNGIVLLVRPNNPTGESIPLDELSSLLDTCARTNTLCIIDEAYVEFAENDALSLLEHPADFILLRTFSKAYGLAGLRVGYMLANKAYLLEGYRKRCLPFNVSSVSLFVAEKALEEKAQTEVKQYCQKIAENRATLVKQLDSYGIRSNVSQANFLLLALNPLQKTLLLANAKQQGILLREFGPGDLHTHVRVTIPYDSSTIETLFKRSFSPELICLDMDGVLIDTSTSYDLAIQQTVEYFSSQSVPIEKIQSKRCEGGYNNDWVLSQALLSDLGTEVDLNEVIDFFQSCYLGRSDKPGLINNEKALISSSLSKSLSSEGAAIFTGRPRAEAELGAKLCGLSHLDIVSLDDVREGKPNPEGIEKLKSQKAANITWMCGDNVDDMQAANSAGAVAIGIGEKKAALLAAGATIVLESINDLEQLLSC